MHDINLRFNLSIFKNEEEKKKAKNDKTDNETNCYTQLKNFLNLYSHSKKQSRSSINTNRPKSVKFNHSSKINESSKSPEVKNKLRGAIATIKQISKKSTINPENNHENQSNKFSCNNLIYEKKESKLGIRSLKTINQDKISNEMTGINLNNVNPINQNSQSYKNPNQDDFQNQNNNAVNPQTKVLPINFRKNSISILAGYEIKDIDSLINFMEREKTSNKKVIDDEKEKENFNHIISNKYAYEVELEKYSNYIQKRQNSNNFIS